MQKMLYIDVMDLNNYPVLFATELILYTLLLAKNQDTDIIETLFVECVDTWRIKTTKRVHSRKYSQRRCPWAEMIVEA